MLVKQIKIGHHTVKTPAICGAVMGGTVAEMKKLSRKAFKEGADVVEFRVDNLRSIAGWKELLKIDKPFILTIRPKGEGGSFAGTERERTDLLSEAIELKVPAVDIELSTQKNLRNSLLKKTKKAGVTVIMSQHHFSSTPNYTELVKSLTAAEKSGCDIVKLVTFARNQADAFRMLEFVARNQARPKIPLIAFSMGKEGVITRFIGPILGVPLVYAAVGTKTAPGQPDIETTKEHMKNLAEKEVSD